MQNEYFIIFDFLGTIAFAINGFLMAVRKKLDFLGAIIISILTALGGGMMRDLLTQNEIFVFHHIYPLSLVLITFTSTLIIYKLFYQHSKTDSKYSLKTIHQISDSVGIVFFAQAGSLVAIEANFHFIGVLFISLITATGGGMLRDILVNEVPSIMKKEFYGTVAIIMGTLIMLEDLFYEVNEWTVLGNMLVGLGLKYIIYKMRVNSPRI